MPVVDPASERLYGPLHPGFGERVATALTRLGDKRTAAELVGLSKDQLNKIIAEKAVPNFAAMAALARHSGYSMSWLAFGGELSTETSVSGAESSSADRSVFIPHRSGAAAAAVVLLRAYGMSGNLELMSSAPFDREYLERVLRLSPDDVALLQHSGDAMSPTIADKDLLMLNLRRREISDGAIVAVRLGGELLTKRVQREGDGSVNLLSDNKSYGPIKLIGDAVSRLDVLGRVVWSGGAI